MTPINPNGILASTDAPRLSCTAEGLAQQSTVVLPDYNSSTCCGMPAIQPLLEPKLMPTATKLIQQGIKLSPGSCESAPTTRVGKYTSALRIATSTGLACRMPQWIRSVKMAYQPQRMPRCSRATWSLLTHKTVATRTTREPEQNSTTTPERFKPHQILTKYLWLICSRNDTTAHWSHWLTIPQCSGMTERLSFREAVASWTT